MTAADEYLAAHYASLGSLDNDFRNANLVRLVADSVRGSRVLDIGCGSGGLLKLLHSRGKSVAGLEPNSELVRLANSLHPELQIRHGEGGAVRSFAEPFETITIIDVLEHIEDDVAQIHAMHERLVPGGQLVVIVPCSPLLYGERDRAQGHFRRYTRKELITKLRDGGFLIDRTRYWNALGYLPYLFAERLMGRPLQVSLRTSLPKSWLQKLAIRALHVWFQTVERHVNFGLGLSLLCLAHKPADAPAVITPLRRAA